MLVETSRSCGLQGVLSRLCPHSSIVVTGALSILRGGLISVTGGTLDQRPAAGFRWRRSGFGLPVPIIVMVALTVLAFLWMLFGLRCSLYAIGGKC